MMNIHSTKARVIAPLIFSTRYYNAKAQKLKNYAIFVADYNFDYTKLRACPIHELRTQLMAIKGIGNETADSILLYAYNKLSFIIDAYTLRVFSRLDFFSAATSYLAAQSLFEQNIPPDIDLYQDFHAQIVFLANKYCHTKPLCNTCPLISGCPYARRR